MEARPRPDVNSDISNLLWMLRSENATQYFTLVKMHLSFTTDLSTDECDGKLDNTKNNSGKWNLTPLKKRFRNNSTSGTPKCVMDGVPLTQEGVCHAYQLINFLSKEENIKQEGIFRKTGSCSRQLDLKNSLNAGVSLNLERAPYSAHDCASVLKNFLAELPEPLLQEDHYHVHCRIAEMCSHEINLDSDSQSYKRRVKALQLVFLLLPFANYQLLKDLLLLLHKVAQKQDQNKMSAGNLGTMFAPQILCPRKMTPNDMRTLSKVLSRAVAFMIENAEKLFHIPFELEVDVRHYWSNRNKSPCDETDGSMAEAPTATSFSFVGKELSAKASDIDVTNVALANLYAYVQSLPESARGKGLVKQFNEASGRGTPVKGRAEQKEPKMRTISDSIKRRLLSKSIKNKKTKLQELSGKRISSDDCLNNSSCCSPELKLFRRMSPKFSSKSMEELSPLRTNTTSPPYDLAIKTPQSICVTPSRKPYTADSSREFVSTPEFGFYGTVSLSDQSLDASTVSLRTPSGKRNRPLCANDLPNLSSREDSPISRAVLKSNIQQKDIMTPRSRCPIMINSCTSLVSVYINDLQKQNQPDGDSHSSPDEGKENCLNTTSSGDISTAGAGSSVSSGLSMYNSASSSIPSSYNSLSSNSSLGDKSITNSERSLFGGFFDKLSTSSLVKLTSGLSGSSLRRSGRLSPCMESATLEEAVETSGDDSLSNVFKDYLNRSFTTTQSKNDSEDTQEKMQESIAGHIDPYQTPPVATSLSDSLLYCLDGNNPMSNSKSTHNSVGSLPIMGSTLSDSSQDSLSENLYSCSPNGRTKLFFNKHGTPLPKSNQDESISLADQKSVIFETSF